MKSQIEFYRRLGASVFNAAHTMSGLDRAPASEALALAIRGLHWQQCSASRIRISLEASPTEARPTLTRHADPHESTRRACRPIVDPADPHARRHCVHP